jgi:hypothetical protein
MVSPDKQNYSTSHNDTSHLPTYENGVAICTRTPSDPFHAGRFVWLRMPCLLVPGEMPHLPLSRTSEPWKGEEGPPPPPGQERPLPTPTTWPPGSAIPHYKRHTMPWACVE